MPIRIPPLSCPECGELLPSEEIDFYSLHLIEGPGDFEDKMCRAAARVEQRLASLGYERIKQELGHADVDCDVKNAALFVYESTEHFNALFGHIHEDTVRSIVKRVFDRIEDNRRYEEERLRPDVVRHDDLPDLVLSD